MSLIKIKTQIEQEIEVDIEFPLYKSYAGLCKVISEKEYIRVSNYYHGTGIEHQTELPGCSSDIIFKGKDISEQEFTTALAEQVSKFNGILCMQPSELSYENAPMEIFSRNMQLCDQLNDLP